MNDRVSIEPVIAMLTENQRDEAWRAETVLSTVINRLNANSEALNLATELKMYFREAHTTNKLSFELFRSGVQNLRALSAQLAEEVNDLGLQLDIALLLSSACKSGLLELPQADGERPVNPAFAKGHSYVYKLGE